MVGELATFAAVSVVVIVTPGQDTALTIRNTLAAGRRGGVATAGGVALGQACWTVAAALGATGVLLASAPAFTIVKFVGAAYLIALGLQALRAAFRQRLTDRPPTRARDPVGARTAFRQGLISNLANPKMAAFFGSLLPQFAPADRQAFPVLLALGLTFCVMTLVWLSSYAAAITVFRDTLFRPAVRRRLDAVTGLALMVVGVRLAFQHRPS